MEPSILKAVGTFIKDCWAYLAALIGILTAVYRYLIKPVIDRRKKKEQEQEDILKGLATSVKELQDSVKEISKDMGFLQHDRLIQGHDYYMRLGWIPTHVQENLIQMYDRYISQGRNSLFKSYRDDILNLPPEKDTNWGAEKGA